MANPSLIIGDGNWAVKSDSLLGYKVIDSKYYPREMTFTRATTGTRVNAAGLVEVTPYNLLSWSEQFDNAAWAKLNSTISANTTTAPDGTITADSLIDNSTNSIHVVNNSSGGVGVFTFSFYAKANTLNRVGLLTAAAVNTTLASTAQVFDLSNGTVVNTISGVTATITNVGDGWYRCSTTLTALASGAYFITCIKTGTNIAYIGSGESLFIWGGQLVEGTQPLTYLPTTDRLDIPRIDYSTGSSALLLEPQRTNVNAKSNDFTISSGYWYDYNFRIPIANQGISPDGTNNAWRLPLNSILTTEYGKDVGGTIGDKTAASIWAKGSEAAFTLEIQNVVNTDVLGSVTVNLNTGVIISGSGTIESYSNGWYRITTVGTSTITNGYPRSFVKNPNSACLIYGFQYEAGSYATSYIPTTSASVTRNRDQCVKTGITDFIGQTEGTLFVNAIGTKNVQATAKFLMQILGSKNISITFYGGNINVYSQLVDLSVPFTPNQIYKIAVCYSNSGNFRLFVNGVKTHDVNTYASGTYSDLGVGCRTIGDITAETSINSAQLYKVALTDVECITLTTL